MSQAKWIPNASPTFADAEEATIVDHAANTRVATIMQTKVFAIYSDMTVRQARDRLRRLRAQHAPVLNEERRPIGMVTLDDLVRASADTDPRAFKPEPDPLYTRTDAEIRYPLDCSYHLARTTEPIVADVMSIAFPLPGNASVARAAGLMHWEMINEVVITDDAGRLAGLVSATDIVRWLAEESGYAPGMSVRDTIPDSLPDSDNLSRKSPAKTVLVVDDDDAICEGLVELLQDEGFEAFGASDGREALEILGNMPTEPGLILLDLTMPNMNGWEFREQQLRDDRLSPIPVVVLTAHAKSLKRDELRSPAAVLAKPVGVKTLIQTIQAHYSHLN